MTENWVTGQLANATANCVLSFRSFGGICKTASCPVRKLAIRELVYPRVVQLPKTAEKYEKIIVQFLFNSVRFDPFRVIISSTNLSVKKEYLQ